MLVRFFLGLALCCLIGALVDVPFTVMALFPAIAIQLALAFFGLPVVIWAVRPVLRGARA